MPLKNKCCQLDLAQVAQTLKLISEPSRLKILCLLKGGSQCVCQLQEQLEQRHNLVCHHLKKLVSLGLITASKKAGFTYYCLNKKNYQKVVKQINKLLGV